MGNLKKTVHIEDVTESGDSDKFDEGEDRFSSSRSNNIPRISVSPVESQALLHIPSSDGPTNHSSSSSRHGSRHGSENIPEISMSRRPSSVLSIIRRQSIGIIAQRRILMDMLQGRRESRVSMQQEDKIKRELDPEYRNRMKNRRVGDDALTNVLSAFYAKLLVVLGIAFPVSDVLTGDKYPLYYQGFYLYLYVGSVVFVGFMYSAHLRTRALFSMIDKFQDKKNPIIKKSVARYGSFFLRVGAVAFGIGSMVYSGLEFGQYFELKGDKRCQNILIALTPAARIILAIAQMQFIFLNTKEFEMNRHKVIARFGIMHMVATNLCEWLYVLVEETKHEIVHLKHISELMPNNNEITELAHNISTRSTGNDIIVDCKRTNIMGSLVQNASPFLFPCTIEYSLICAVILFEMWKQIKPIDSVKPERKISESDKGAHQLSVDCSRAHRGMFSGILVIVLSIISIIMFYVLSEDPKYHSMATLEVSIAELILYILATIGIVLAFLKMRDLKFYKSYKGMPLDCTLLLLAQTGVYVYSMFSIIACYFSIKYDAENDHGSEAGLVAEVFSLIQTSIQTIFIINAWYRRIHTEHQIHTKPGRETITFLLVANMAMWFLNTLAKNRAMFRTSHLKFFGLWGWTVITHVSMPLAIFYRFHSTICLFEIWKTAFKEKREHIVTYQE